MENFHPLLASTIVRSDWKYFPKATLTREVSVPKWTTLLGSDCSGCLEGSGTDRRASLYSVHRKLEGCSRVSIQRLSHMLNILHSKTRSSLQLPLVLIGSLIQHWETSPKSWEWTTSDTLEAYSFTDVPANAFETSSRCSSSQFWPFLYGNCHISVTPTWRILGTRAFKCGARVPLPNAHSLCR